MAGGGGFWPSKSGEPHWARVSEIARVLVRHGLGVVAARLGIAACPTWRCRWRCTRAALFGDDELASGWPEAVKSALIELGPAFVKAGQILSVRGELVPPELAEALHALQSDVPPVPFEAVRATLEAELGAPLESAFRTFNPVPLAAASIAQVHVASLHDGTDVAVKIKRPGIDALVLRDLEILLWLAERMERSMPWTRRYRPVAAARELALYTRRELDFRLEADVATRVGAHFAAWEAVVIPRVYRASRHLMVMDYVSGVPIDDLASLARLGVDRQRLVRTAVDCVLEQLFVLGLFHADPHPGNLHVTPDGRLVLLDFGIFGELTESIKRYAGLAMVMLAEGEFDAAARYLLRLATLEPDADPAGYRLAVAERYRAWCEATVEEYGFAQLVYDLVTLGARHGVIYPAVVILYVKAMVTLEGVSLVVAPEVNMLEEARPFMARLEDRLFSPRQVAAAVRRSWPLWLELGERLPFEGERWLERHLEEPRPRPREPERPGPSPALVAVAAGVVLLLGEVGPQAEGVSILGLLIVAIALGGLSRRD